MTIDVIIFSRKLIKPCIPTPVNLNRYKISYIDEVSPTMNVGVLLFYRSKPKLISLLEESLSEILTEFYPLAGRYVDEDRSVDCSDQGAEFVAAEASDVELNHLIAGRETEQLHVLLPRQSNEVVVAPTSPLLSVQVTAFKCGGVAIGISISHRIFDASSIGTFVAAWSNASNPEAKIGIISPSFDSPSLFPCRNKSSRMDWDHGSNSDSQSEIEDHDHKIVVKRFSFNNEAITSIKSKLRPKDGKRLISRVRVVCAVIAAALMRVDTAKRGEPRSCIINQAINMRERTIPPLHKHSCGNLILQSVSRRISATETEHMGIQDLVHVLGDAIDKTVSDCAKILSLGEDGCEIVAEPWKNLVESSESGEVNVIWFSDWTKFGFYEADFGWGKPVWAGIGAMAGEKLAVLMENEDGDGIEAWMHLSRDDMPYFEQDEQIKFFAK